MDDLFKTATMEQYEDNPDDNVFKKDLPILSVMFREMKTSEAVFKLKLKEQRNIRKKDYEEWIRKNYEIIRHYGRPIVKGLRRKTI